MLTDQSDRFTGGGIHHPFVTAGQAYAIGLSGVINEHEFGGSAVGLIFTNIVDESDADVTAATNTQRTRNEVIQFPEELYNVDLHFNINVQEAQESRTLEVQLRQMMSATDDVVVDFASGQGGSSSGTGHVTVDFRWDFWRPDPDEKYYFAIPGEGEACNQADWRNRQLSGFLQIRNMSAEAFLRESLIFPMFFILYLAINVHKKFREKGQPLEKLPLFVSLCGYRTFL